MVKLNSILRLSNISNSGDTKVSGHVDRLERDIIHGWAAASSSKSPIEVRALQGDNIVGRTIADRFRPDLRDAGIGNGNHGFALRIQRATLQKDEPVRVVAGDSMQELQGSPLLLAAPSSLGKTFFDVSDLFFYLAHHDHPSGIQRVQISVIEATVNDLRTPVESLAFVYYDEASMSFVELNASRVLDLLSDLQFPKSDRMFPTGTGDLGRFLAALGGGTTPTFDDKSVLVMLGAAWVFPEYFTAVRNIQANGSRFCALIHDLIPIKMPSMCDKGTAEVFKFFLRRAVEISDQLLTVSASTKADLEEYIKNSGLKQQARDIIVTHNGSSIPATGRSTNQYKPDWPYVLFVSTIEGRKNHILAFKIWLRLKAELGEKAPRLILVGRVGWRVEEFMELLYDTNFLDGHIIIKSEVSDAELMQLYTGCLFTIYPSLYEGWGLPVGESLALGKVCVASSTTSIPEVARGQAILVDPSDFDRFYSEVKSLATDSKKLDTLEAKVRESYKPFEWAEVASTIAQAVSALQKAPSEYIKTIPINQEIVFRRLEYLTSNVSHGDEVSRHANKFSAPGIGRERVTIGNYVLADLVVPGPGLFHREDWGRWSQHRKGVTFDFKVDVSNRLALYLLLRVPVNSSAISILIKNKSGNIERRQTKNTIQMLRIELDNYVYNGHVFLNIDTESPAHVPNDTRSIGLGIESALLVPADDLTVRLDILERHLLAN